MDEVLASRLRSLDPEREAALADLNAAAWKAVPPTLLELCRRRLAAMLGDEEAAARGSARSIDERKLAALDDWESSPLFTAAERAHLAFTEQFVTSVSSMSDGDVDALLEHSEPREVHEFVNALYVVDMTQRLEMVARATLVDDDA